MLTFETAAYLETGISRATKTLTEKGEGWFSFLSRVYGKTFTERNADTVAKIQRWADFQRGLSSASNGRWDWIALNKYWIYTPPDRVAKGILNGTSPAAYTAIRHIKSAAKLGVPVDRELLESAGGDETGAAPAGGIGQTYTIRAGDTMSAMTRAVYGAGFTGYAKWNALFDKNKSNGKLTASRGTGDRRADNIAVGDSIQFFTLAELGLAAVPVAPAPAPASAESLLPVALTPEGPPYALIAGIAAVGAVAGYFLLSKKKGGGNGKKKRR